MSPRLLTCCFVLLLAVIGTHARAATYTEDFNAGDGGWEALKGGGVDIGIRQPTGGVGNSGYLEGTRPDGLAPAFNPGNPPASASGLGDLGALYGNLIEISYFARIFAMGTDRPVLHLFGASGTNWVREIVAADALDPFRNDWTFVSLSIDTSWSDAEAAAAGWFRLSGAGSWSSVLGNVASHHPFYGFSGGDATAGIDDVRIASVPLPGAAVLLLSALAALQGGARRTEPLP